ncbi:MAG: translocation/assembly module TamB [Treponema sp.]|nr:translocation/assembly module TamB [Treponema sp.]
MADRAFSFRLCIQILVIAALLALAGLLVAGIWGALSLGLTGVRDGLIGGAEERLGRRITYSSISPSLLGAFDVRDLAVAGYGDSPVLAAGRLRLSYSLFDLVFRRTLTVRSFRLDSPLVDFDTSRDLDLAELLDSLGGEGERAAVGVRFTEGLSVLVRGGTFILRGPVGTARLDDFNFVAGTEGRLLNLDGSWNLLLAGSGPLAEEVRVNLAMRAEGSLVRDLGDGEGVLLIPGIQGDALSSVPMAFAVSLKDGLFRIEKIADSLPLELSFGYDVASGEMDGGLSSAGFVIGDFLALDGALADFSRILEVSVSGTAELTRLAEGTLSYRVDLAGGSPAQGPASAFVLDVFGDGDGFYVREASFTLPEDGEGGSGFSGTVAFAGGAVFDPFGSKGTLSVKDLTRSGFPGLSAVIDIGGGPDGVSFTSGDLRLGRSDPVSFALNVVPGSRDTAFDVALFWPAPEGGKPGTALVRGVMGSSPRSLDATLSVSSMPVLGMAEMLLSGKVPKDLLARGGGGSAGLGVLRMDADGVLSTDFVRFRYGVSELVFSGGGFFGSFPFSGTESFVEFDGGRVEFSGETLDFSGGAEFGGRDGFAFTLNADYRGIPYLVEGRADGGSVYVGGPNDLDLRLFLAETGVSGHVLAEGFPLPFLGRPALLSVNAGLDSGGGGNWELDVRRLELADLAAPTGLSRIRVSGSAAGGPAGSSATFPELSFRDGTGELFGAAAFSWGDGKLLGDMVLGDGEETYAAEGSFGDGTLRLEMAASSVRLYRFSRAFSALVADGTLALGWDFAGNGLPEAELVVSRLHGNGPQGEISARGRLSLVDRSLTLAETDFDLSGLTGRIPALVLAVDDGRLRGNAEFGGAINGRPVRGLLSLDSSFVPTESWWDLDRALDEFSGSVDFVNAVFGEGGATQDFGFEFSRSGGNMRVSGGPRDMLRFIVDERANFLLVLSSPFPVRGSFVGSLRDGILDARGNDLLIDLAGLYAFLPADEEFFISEGFVSASLDVFGPVADPEFRGTARASGVRIHVPGFIARELRPVPFSAVFEGGEIRFGPVQVAVGGGAGTVSAVFAFERWVPRFFNLDIVVPARSPIPFAMNLTGFMAQGDTSGNLTITLENRSMNYSGNLFVNRTELSVDNDEIWRTREPFGNEDMPFNVDITINSGPSVEFLYPDRRFPVVRATAEMGSSIQVMADSVARQFAVVGDVQVRRGEVFYIQRSFYVRSGQIVFRENETLFDPRLTVRAELRERNQDGPVTISMLVDNEPLSSFNARFEASPPLSQAEISSLLWQRVAGAGFDEAQAESDSGRVLLSSGLDILSQFTAMREFERVVRNFSGLDMFSIRTQALQNIVFSGLMPQEVDTTLRVGDYFDNTTIFVGKYIGQDLFAQVMLSMRHDPGRQDWGGLVLRPDISLDFLGPYIAGFGLRIRWDFSPEARHTMFVDDNSISLILRRVF